MKRIHITLLILILPLVVHAQSEEAKIAVVINTLFKSMATADSVLLRSTFSTEVTMASIFKNKEGKQIVNRENSIDDFVNSVGSTQPGLLAEEIWNLKTQIDGDFAQAWCDYAFYYQHKFTHCGVDAFHLIKTNEGWRIFHLVDTRRKEGCNVPEEIQAKHR